MHTPATPSAASSVGTSQPTPSIAKSGFLAAEEIAGILQGRDKTEQERIIRWVTESLGLAPVAAIPTAPTTSALTPVLTSPSTRIVQHAYVAPGRPKDIKSFVDEKRPKSDMQFAAVVAYFYAFEAPEANRKGTITADELQEAARLAGWKRFDRPAVPLNNAISQGYLDRAGRGEFRLNAVGENLVAMALPGTDGDATSNTTGRPRRKQARKRRKMQTKKPNAP
jgi:hypothetical protein